MEHVNIISQETITEGLKWPPVIFAFIGLLFCFAAFGYLIFHKYIKGDYLDRVAKLLMHAMACIVLMMLTMGICSIFFPVETGRYKYSGTLDDDMTIVEFKEFQETYTNIEYKDGIWYWEDKE